MGIVSIVAEDSICFGVRTPFVLVQMALCLFCNSTLTRYRVSNADPALSGLPATVENGEGINIWPPKRTVRDVVILDHADLPKG